MVFLGKVPGPSDLRKNQLTQYEIKYAEELKGKNYQMLPRGQNPLDYLHQRKNSGAAPAANLSQKALNIPALI